MRKLSFWVAALTATAAVAQSPTVAPQTRQTGVSNDPNETVCVNERQIGSRVATRRVCRTRAEWETLRQQTRQITDRVQMNKATTCPPSC